MSLSEKIKLNPLADWKKEAEELEQSIELARKERLSLLNIIEEQRKRIAQAEEAMSSENDPIEDDLDGVKQQLTTINCQIAWIEHELKEVKDCLKVRRH